jgi:hypothetical protein
MAYNNQVTSIRDKLQLDKIINDEIFDEVKQTIEKLVEKNNNKPIPKRYIELAISEFQNEIGGSNPILYNYNEIKNNKFYEEIKYAFKQCINNLEKSEKTITQDKLRSAVNQLQINLVSETLQDIEETE